jgi:DNA (cytosine-5)-methyltransferase 1
LNCIDLFAGAGGFSLAARLAGLTVRLAVERDRHAASTYRENLCDGEGKPILLEEDITMLSPASVAAMALPDGERCDVLVGGPPCQGFSTHRLNNSGVGDERNELVDVYFSFVNHLRPRAFLMENVPGMLWPRHAKHLQSMRKQALEAGYHLYDPVVIDARDFGIPQRRKRVFILGIEGNIDRGDFSWPPVSTHRSPDDREANRALPPWVACADVFDPPPDNDPNNVHMNHNADLVAAFEKTPKNGGSRNASGRVLECHREHDGHSDVYGRIDPSLPAPTMTTACINPSKGRFVHPTLPHGITVRQAARIQTFPDDYVFNGGLMAAGAQIGNAVPVKLGAVLIRHVLDLLPDRGKQSVEHEGEASVAA